MRAMILAAGRGERLRPLTERIPKPLIPLAGEPLIVHQLRWLHRAGIRDVVINLHHLGEAIERALGTGTDLGIRIHYSREPDLLDTGGGIKKALPDLLPGPFVLMNGDIWTNYPFRNLTDVHPAKAHLVLTPTPAHKDRADFHLETTGGVARVRRGAANDLTYCGIAVFGESLFANTPEGAFSLTDPLFQAVNAGEVTGEIFNGTWIDIGAPEELKRARRITA
ncbi:MAG: nucleotidyltransferase family protein [Pseudomonadales bacterium]|nr:nucleotidyltransferase family protein [Pseudomonadales bacterium]